jgi:hypothetical protein
MPKVRMLVDHKEGKEFYPCNSVQEFDDAKAKSLVKGGAADDDPAAVAFAEKQAEEEAKK